MLRRSVVYAAYAAAVASALGLAVREPFLFQKLNTLRPAPGIPALRASEPVDVEALMRPVPLHGRPVRNVHPETRWRRTLVEGGGNCSQISFGLAYHLSRIGVDYQIIHMLTSEGLALGQGHTVVRLRYRLDGATGVGLLDASFGVMLHGAKGVLDVEDVENAPVPGWDELALNDAARFPDYDDDFLTEAVIGYVPKADVDRYYAFLDRVYRPLGSDIFEKYVFDGMALVFGVLPRVWVPEYGSLVDPLRGALLLHRGALWILRSTLVVLPLFALLEVRRLARGRADVDPAPAGR